MCLGCIRFPTKSRAIFFLFSKNGNRTPQKSFSKRNFIQFANTIKEISCYILTNSYYFFFFFLVHMRILRERDKENFCFRKQKLKASVKSKIEIKLYYLKIPYLESRIPKIPSREKGRVETEIERERGWGEERGGNIPSLICTIDSANSFAAEKNPFVFPRTFREM